MAFFEMLQLLLYLWSALWGILTNLHKLYKSAQSGGPQMYLRPTTGKHGHLYT